MNYIRHLSAFFNLVKKDNRLTAMHVSLYIALFQYWNLNRFQNPFKVYRNDIMKMSRIGSKNTYHKSMKELHQAGYILQHPDKSKYSPTQISIIRLDKKEEPPLKQLNLFIPENLSTNAPDLPQNQCPTFDTDRVPHLTPTCPTFDTSPVPNMGHLIKHINNKRINSSEKNNSTIKSEDLKKANQIPRVSNMGHTNPQQNIKPEQLPNHLPKLLEIQHFFKSNNFPDNEAKKFFHHYQSTAWLIAGKIPIHDWHSLAHKWMLNKHSIPSNLNLDNDTSKNYAEPL